MNLAPVADAHDLDWRLSIFHAGDGSQVARAILPKGAKLAPFEGFADASGILKRSDSFYKTSQNSPPRRGGS
jgi:hypothetical protein